MVVNPTKSTANTNSSYLLPLIDEFKNYRYLGVEEESDSSYDVKMKLTIITSELKERLYMSRRIGGRGFQNVGYKF